MNGPVKNTDRESCYREDTGDPAGSYYENSLFVTEAGGIGMNVGGTVIVRPMRGLAHASICGRPVHRAAADPIPPPRPPFRRPGCDSLGAP
jgi:hypothetical protein